MMGEILLIVVALAYSAAVTAIGRRLPRPASVTAYVTAVAILIAVPLLPDPIAQQVDRIVPIVGAGRLLVHLAFMTVLSGLFLTIVLAMHRWSWRQQVAVGGAGVLTVLFIVLWWFVQTLHLPNRTALFYGIRAGHPIPMLWMNVVMGTGIVYIAVCGVVEFQLFLRAARNSYERGVAGISIVLYALTGVAGMLTITEAVARHRGVDMAVVQQVKTPFSAGVLILTAVLLAGQIWLWPLWRHRRQWLARYIEPELVQLRHDLLNLSAEEAELHLDIHHEHYANRAIVEAVAARCRAEGMSLARTAIARMAASLLTFHRDNVIQDTRYGLVTSWEDLMAAAAAEIDQTMALTAWEKALRESYIAQHVYRLMFLVLDSRAFREKLLIDERPRVEAWHEQLADLIATVMQAHGHPTPRYESVARRAAHRRARLWARLVSAWRGARAGRARRDSDTAENEGEGTSTI